LRSVPVRRFAQPEEIAAAITFLAGEKVVSSQVGPCL